MVGGALADAAVVPESSNSSIVLAMLLRLGVTLTAAEANLAVLAEPSIPSTVTLQEYSMSPMRPRTVIGEALPLAVRCGLPGAVQLAR
jgi:hypothetical protein